MFRLIPPSGLAMATFAALLVGLAGCAAWIDRRASGREAAWEAAFPPEGQLVRVEGRQLHVLEAGRRRGTAPDVVLIHGANGSMRDFTFDLVDRLAPDFRVIAVDRPGHGWSESWGAADSDPRAQARILRAALAEWQLHQPIVVGHSYGGAVAMAWALESEPETGAVVLLAGATMPWQGRVSRLYDLIDSPLGPLARGWIAGMVPDATVRSVTRQIFAPDRMPPGYVAHFGPGMSIRRGAQATNARQVNSLNRFVAEMSGAYARLTLPIEALHGTSDTIVGLSVHSEPLALTIPSVNLTVMEGVGHMPHHARPDETIAAIHRAAQRRAARTAAMR
jgi:pimeloyl-ACP methyl ester carboxylesterase